MQIDHLILAQEILKEKNVKCSLKINKLKGFFSGLQNNLWDLVKKYLLLRYL